jgi:hypothetical protein
LDESFAWVKVDLPKDHATDSRLSAIPDDEEQDSDTQDEDGFEKISWGDETISDDDNADQDSPTKPSEGITKMDGLTRRVVSERIPCGLKQG